MNNFINEVTLNGQDFWQANIDHNKFIIDDNKVWVNYGCNIDEINIIEFTQNENVEYKIYSCTDAKKVIQEVAYDVVSNIIGDCNYRLDEFTYEDAIYDSINCASMDELIDEINSTKIVKIRLFNIDDFLCTNIKSKTIKNVLSSNNIFM